SGPPPALPSALSAEAQASLDLVNSYRAQNGLGALQPDAVLQGAAEWLSADMLANCVSAGSECGHTDSTGRTPFRRLSDFGYPVSASFAESLYWGPADSAGAAEQALAYWQQSPAQNQNLLNPGFAAIGIAGGCADAGCAWVAVFGNRVVQALGQ